MDSLENIYTPGELKRATRNLFVPYLNERDYMGNLTRTDAGVDQLCEEHRYRVLKDKNEIKFKKFLRQQLLKKRINLEDEEKRRKKEKVYDFTRLSNVKLSSMFTKEEKMMPGIQC